jgi:heme-degrading monooxygenase HmoA
MMSHLEHVGSIRRAIEMLIDDRPHGARERRLRRGRRAQEAPMYATIKRYKLKKGQSDAVTRQITDDFLPMISELPGFVSYDVMTDGDRMWTVSVFETEHAASESSRRAREYVQENLATALPTAPEAAEGEVTVHKAAARGPI